MMKKLLFTFFALGSMSLSAQQLDVVVADGQFKTDDASLQQFETPEWYQDAKFGIWAHWGPQCVPMQGDWYARRMYMEDHPIYKYHVEHYGHPSEFGYKDIIPLWKAENFDPDKLMKLYKRAGAKYFVSMGAHHDGFDLWNSKHNRWNAVNMGPKRDIVGEWAKAARDNGMRFGISEHAVRAYNWMALSHGSDMEGEKAGVPYDGNDPENADLYFPPKTGDNWIAYPENAPTWWQEAWYNRMQDLIQNYKPDYMYFDGAIPMEKTGRTLLADYYNQNMTWHDGNQEGVVSLKEVGEGTQWGEYIPGAGIKDEEHGTINDIRYPTWESGTSIGNWFYDVKFRNKENGGMYFSAGKILRSLTDVVSKNGCFLMNVVQRPDGSIDPEVEDILEEMAAWMELNGEAIFATRPWYIYGEGSTQIDETQLYNLSKEVYKHDDIRFTRSKDNKTLYVTCFYWPENNRVVIKTLGSKTGVIKTVKSLATNKKIKSEQTKDGLILYLPESMKTDLPFCFEIDNKYLQPMHE